MRGGFHVLSYSCDGASARETEARLVEGGVGGIDKEDDRGAEDSAQEKKEEKATSAQEPVSQKSNETSPSVSIRDSYFYHESESLAYGVDWILTDWSLRASTPGFQPYIASCSFYNHLFSIWRSKA